MFDFRAFWLRLGYVLGFREEPPKFERPPATTDAATTTLPPRMKSTLAETVNEDWTGRRLLTHVILAGFVAAIGYGLFTNAGRVLIPLIWALGTLALGTLTGFLFCLPRIRQGELADRDTDKSTPTDANDPTKPKPSAARNTDGYGLDINTNLEQISDWLSKIIVGLGLVELRQIPGHLVELSDYIAKDMGDPSARAFACGLVLFFSVCGFLYGYLYMRLILSHRFREADQKSKGLDRQKLEATAGEALDMFEIVNAEMAGMQAERADATLHEVEDAIRLLEAARKLQPGRRKTNMLLGVLYAMKKKDYTRGIQICEETINAMRRSNSLTAKDEADFLYNIACFRMTEANALPQGDPRKAELETQSLQELERAIRISPALKQLAAEPEQKEWNAVRDRAEFQRMVAE
jgi:hypothetical protein